MKDTAALRDELSEKWGAVNGEFMISNGRFCQLFYPGADDINITVIAKALSKLCRFNGHTRSFYSVAQHSVHVSQNVPRKDALHALLHDASEAYLGDVIRPIKSIPQMEVYIDAERLWQTTIFEHYGLETQMPDSVKLADNRMLMTEFRDLFDRTPPGCTDSGIEPYPHFVIQPLYPEAAYDLFCSQWEELTHS